MSRVVLVTGSSRGLGFVIAKLFLEAGDTVYVNYLSSSEEELKSNPDYLEKIYKEGAEKAYQVAHKTLEDVYKKIGLII